MSETANKNPARRTRGVDRVIELCQQLHHNRAPMTPRELVAATGAPRSSVYDLIGLLIEAGWLDTDNDGRVFFGRAMHYYGLDYADHNHLLKRARPVMRRLSAKFDETTQLCMLDGDKYTVMLNEHGARPFAISSEVGVKVPIPWTASGRVLLGSMSREAIRTLIPDSDFVLPHGGTMDTETFFADIDRARHWGYAMTEGLVDTFACCIAVPIRDDDGQARATLCFTVGRDTSDERRQCLLNALIEAGHCLSRQRATL